MKKLDSLTALRFFAAVSILIEHSRPSFRSMDWIPHFRYDFGVSFFFVLSGFILCCAYREFNGLERVWNFYAARIARIWPLHLITLCAFFLLMPTGRWFLEETTGHHLEILAANIFLVQAWIPKAAFFFSGNAVAWSISAETFFYLMFPLLRYRWKRTWHWKSLLITVISLGVALIATWLGVPRFDPSRPMAYSTVGLGYISPFTQMFLFCVGMLAESVYRSLLTAQLPMSSSKWTAIELAAIGLVAVVSHVVGRFADATVLETVAPFFCIAPAFAVLILIFAIGRGAVSQFLSLRLLVVLGEASFALYMSHQIFLMVLLEHRSYFHVPDFVTCTGYWIVAIAIALLLWAFVETPARAWIRKSVSPGLSSVRP